MRNWIRENLDCVLHWNMTLVGGFLGTYAILTHAGTFGSAQTGNLMSAAEQLVGGNLGEVALRLLALAVFGAAVVVSYLLTNFTALNMRRLAILTDAAGLSLAALLPETLHPLVGLYPIFFCSAFQWGTYAGAAGYNSASIFITNNFKQSLLAWTQYVLTKDQAFRGKAVLYTLSVLFFFVGACLGCIAVGALGAKGAFVCFLPLGTAWLFLKAAVVLPAEDGTPQEQKREAQEALGEARSLEKEQERGMRGTHN